MMTQLIAVFIFSCKSSFNIYASKQHSQLALPKQIPVLVSEHQITVHYGVYPFSPSINDIITYRSKLNKMKSFYFN
jgi:hypothetical protein